jgi:hypothetical protein
VPLGDTSKAQGHGESGRGAEYAPSRSGKAACGEKARGSHEHLFSFFIMMMVIMVMIILIK